MKLTVNGTTQKPSVRSALLDTGTSMLLLYYPDWVKLMNTLCHDIELNFNDTLNTSNPIMCKHTGQGFVTVTNCGKGCVERMPKLEIQIDSTIYSIRPTQYLKAVTPNQKVLFNEY